MPRLRKRMMRGRLARSHSSRSTWPYVRLSTGLALDPLADEAACALGSSAGWSRVVV